jgi:hypothetical protein
MNSVEDCLSIARISAKIAYDRFNFDNQKAKLSTYVYTTVKFEMLTQADQESFVKCPSHMREFRVYFMGGYDNDPVKKANFEAKHNLNSPEEIADKKREVESLLPTSLHCATPIITHWVKKLQGFKNTKTLQHLHKTHCLTWWKSTESKTNSTQCNKMYSRWYGKWNAQSQKQQMH